MCCGCWPVGGPSHAGCTALQHLAASRMPSRIGTPRQSAIERAPLATAPARHTLGPHASARWMVRQTGAIFGHRQTFCKSLARSQDPRGDVRRGCRWRQSAACRQTGISASVAGLAICVQYRPRRSGNCSHECIPRASQRLRIPQRAGRNCSNGAICPTEAGDSHPMRAETIIVGSEIRSSHAAIVRLA